MSSSSLFATLSMFAFLAVVGAGCGDDPAPEYVLTLRLSPSTLPASGAQAGDFSVTVVDTNDVRRPELGDRVLVQCQDIGSGVPAGRFDDGAEIGVGIITLDALGVGRASLECAGGSSADYQVTCIAVYEGERGILQPFNCEG